jgi:hypothetical protein
MFCVLPVHGTPINNCSLQYRIYAFMMDNKIPNYLLNTIKCIYRNTKGRIKFNGGISEPVHINKGIR